MPTASLPYCGPAPEPDQWISRWNGDPLLIAAFVGLVLWSLWRQEARPSFYGGCALLALLFLSPFCALTSALFSARAAHHVVLTAVAAPLLVAGWVRLAPPGGPALWTVLHAIIFWFWHAPAAYSAALSNDLVYWLMQASLLGSAMAFWSALRQASAPTAIVLLLATMVQMGLLGALLTFAASPLYTPHLLTTAPWGLTPLADQQLAGLIMWAPGSGLYLAAALLTGWRLLAPRALPAPR